MIRNSRLINWWKKHKDTIIVFFLYFILALIFTWPVIIKLGSTIYGAPGDPFYNLWVFHNLKYSDLLVAQPFGLADINHILQPSQPLIDFISKILTYLSNDVSAYNLMIIFSFPLSGLALYLLVKTISKDSFAAFFAGMVFAFSPYHLAHAGQHVSLSSIYWLTFFVYFLVKTYQNPSIKFFVLSGIFFSLTLMDNYQYSFFALVVLIVFLIFIFLSSWIKNKKIVFNAKILKLIIVGFLIAIAIISIFDFKIIRAVFNKDSFSSLGPSRTYSELAVYSARSFNYFLPSPQNPLLGKYTSNTFVDSIEQSGSNLTEQVLYLGWIPLLLAFFAIIHAIKLKIKNSPDVQMSRGSVLPTVESGRRRNLKTFIWFFTILAIVGLIFSFAPTINLFGHEIKMPAYYIFKKLTVFRVYSRFGLIVNLSIAVLSGIGLSLLVSNIKKLSFKYLLLVACYSLLVIEFINFPPYNFTNVTRSSMPEVYQILEKSPKGTLAEYPLMQSDDNRSYDYLLWQRYHKFPLVYGAPALSIIDLLRKELLNIEDPKTVENLKKIGVKYVIIHKKLYSPDKTKINSSAFNFGVVLVINNENLVLLEENNQDILYSIK